MATFRHRLLLGAFAALLAALVLWWPGHRARDALRIATWNMEWLVSQPTAHAGRLACRSGRRSTLPCDVVQDLSRDSADLRRIARYTRQLDADIIAFQEVENEAIARRVFPGYRICMATGTGAQQSGFAIRASLPHHCGPQVESLSLGGRNRAGMSMRLLIDQHPPIEMLAVHLKSGCSRDPLDSARAACATLQRQAAMLGEWIAVHATARAPFIVLGDFNRVTRSAHADADADAFWQLLDAAPHVLVADSLRFTNCYTGQPYSEFIDHILVSGNLAHRLGNDARQHGYRSADVVRYRLPDHCPVSISLNIADMT